MHSCCQGKLKLNASKSFDPDGDVLNYSWQVYREPSSYKGEITLSAENGRCSVTIPADGAGKDFHLILKVTDCGTPVLTAYRRVIITIE